MKPAPFDYVVPDTVEEALEHLDRGAGDATILAGGQTLLPLLALRMSTPGVIIDINRIPALQGISFGGGATRIAPVTRQNAALGNGDLAAALPMLTTAIAHVGHFQTRNRGTVGGSISLGEPAAELPAAAVALGAEIEARSLNGERRIPAEEFYIGPYASVLEMDELVTAIHFPDWAPGSITVFHEVARRPGDFALVGLVGALTLEQGRIARAGLAWFGMGPTPMKAAQAEAALIGQTPAQVDWKAVADLAVSETDPFDDHSADADYRRNVGRSIFARTLAEALDQGAMA
ncbi:carbon-monoxide dehydrogenase medium subunit [Novosphingobium sp. CF614]|uniref:FAD binding domain-containing protein n=1 Tax=Novosphingobium sp. CF614 TaxID=1884364 RepID=UPI0008F11723|nr:FAD binding domain-containing protein [Novosphingobium sp. CF614]SFF96806.1 carbon-monoxide dehydrogenase medium subunit [Novosphingobium sp. CF614]